MLDIIPPDATPLKQCTGPCGQFFPATTDYFHVHSKGNLRPMCKTCRNAAKFGQGAEYYAAHKEERHDYYLANIDKRRTDEYRRKRREYRKRTREKQRTQARRYYWLHPEKFRERKRKYSAEHPEVQREYRKATPEKLRAYTNVRRARKIGAEGKYTHADVRKQYARQKGKCYWCSKKLDKYHVDHIVPLSRGGSNWPDNLVIACPTCNCSKNDKLPHEWFEGGRLL